MRRLGSKVPGIVATFLMVGAAIPGPAVGQRPPGAPPLSREQLPPFPEKPFLPPAWAPIPADLQITIVREDLIPGQFRILDVTLNHEVDEATLSSLANLLRDADDMTYVRTYIVYYLPGMTTGNGGWATSHFLPDLEVRFVEPETPL